MVLKYYGWWLHPTKVPFKIVGFSVMVRKGSVLQDRNDHASTCKIDYNVSFKVECAFEAN